MEDAIHWRTDYFSNLYSTVNQNSNRSNKLPADLSEIIDLSSGTLKFTFKHAVRLWATDLLKHFLSFLEERFMYN